MEAVAGIKEDELRALSVEVLDRVDKISEIFTRIDSLFNQVTENYRGPSCQKLNERYGSVRNNYPVIKENIKSYSDDFLTLISKLKENDQYLAKLFKNYTEEVNAKTKADKLKFK